MLFNRHVSLPFSHRTPLIPDTTTDAAEQDGDRDHGCDDEDDVAVGLQPVVVWGRRICEYW
jgi:hypothetical protein